MSEPPVSWCRYHDGGKGAYVSLPLMRMDRRQTKPTCCCKECRNRRERLRYRHDGEYAERLKQKSRRAYAQKPKYTGRNVTYSLGYVLRMLNVYWAEVLEEGGRTVMCYAIVNEDSARRFSTRPVFQGEIVRVTTFRKTPSTTQRGRTTRICRAAGLGRHGDKERVSALSQSAWGFDYPEDSPAQLEARRLSFELWMARLFAPLTADEHFALSQAARERLGLLETAEVADP